MSNRKIIGYQLVPVHYAGVRAAVCREPTYCLVTGDYIDDLGPVEMISPEVYKAIKEKRAEILPETSAHKY